MKIKINQERVLKDIKQLAQFTDVSSGLGITRFSYGDADRRARAYLFAEAKRYGFQTKVDGVGNVLISLKTQQENKGRLMTGSHIDSVINGGTLDGVLGVVGGLEVLRTLAENPRSLNHEICLAIFAEEEGSNFGSTMTGSKFITGIYKEPDLTRLVTPQGKALKELLEENHYPVEEISHIQWDFDEMKAMLELHIEQGPVLDQKKLEIGIVQAIFGMKVIEIELKGMGNHAGASPMEGRRDALTCAAEIILEVEALAKNHESQPLVATVGKIDCYPNASNVIPQWVKFVVEVRDTDNDVIDKTMKIVEQRAKEMAERRGIGWKITPIAQSQSLLMTGEIVGFIEEAAAESGLKYERMNSGAVHDCCMIAQKTKAGMIFVPSIEGRSHVPEERTLEKHMGIGVQLLLDTILKIDEKFL